MDIREIISHVWKSAILNVDDKYRGNFDNPVRDSDNIKYELPCGESPEKYKKM